MNIQEQPQTRTWLTVDQAFASCLDAGLNRTKKTIRSWCRHEHVESQKQTTPTGERWMVEEASLSVKIQAELEFQQENRSVQTGMNPSEPVQTLAEPVHTRTDMFERPQTRSDDDEPRRTASNPTDIESEMASKIRSLEIDKAVRDKQIEFMTKQNEEGQQSLLSQSRYIGHLETQVLQLGGRPDQQFLQAPVPKKDARDFQDHPHQSQSPVN